MAAKKGNFNAYFPLSHYFYDKVYEVIIQLQNSIEGES